LKNYLLICEAAGCGVSGDDQEVIIGGNLNACESAAQLLPRACGAIHIYSAACSRRRGKEQERGGLIQRLAEYQKEVIVNYTPCTFSAQSPESA